MNDKKRNAIDRLYEAAMESKQDKPIESLGELSKALSIETDKATQKRMVKDFVLSHKELHKLLAGDPDFAVNEAELALLELALGAEVVTEEVVTDSRGRKTTRKRVTRGAPNLGALMRWLQTKDPENWAPNPQAEPELEDTEELEEDIYGKKKKP